MASPAKAGSWADGKEFGFDFGGDVEAPPALKEDRLFPDEGG
jgi:hypothetical protein